MLLSMTMSGLWPSGAAAEMEFWLQSEEEGLVLDRQKVCMQKVLVQIRHLHFK